VAVEFDAPIRRTGARRSRLSLPKGGWFVAAGLVVAAVAGGALIGARSFFDGDDVAAGKAVAIARGEPVPLKLNRAPFNPQARDPVDDAAKPQPGAPLEDVIAYVKHGIVKIETSDDWNNRRGLGSGILIDSSGLVATNYHVMADAAKADALFANGTRFGIEGYTAIDKNADLAILKLNGVPPGVKALEVKYDDGPREGSQVYAIGHPYDNEFTTTGGIVSRVLHTRQLPADTRGWLTSTLDETGDNLWIQHDAKISPGNSGGPLINSHGEVIGINSWVNQKAGLGYAIHAQHLHELLRHQNSTVTALKLRRRTMPEASQSQFAGLHVASDRIKELRTQLAAQGWRPQKDEDCATFDELARAITAVKYIQSHPGAQIPIPSDEQLAVVREADEAVAALATVRWQDAEQILPINAHGGQDRAPYGGAFLFGRVKRLVHGREDQRAALIELVGSNEPFFLPLEESVAAVAEGTCILVVGVATPETVRLEDNSLAPIKARVLLSKVVLPIASRPGG
jgi:S1-C subfamily serine protease